MHVRYLLGIHSSWSLPAVLCYKFGWVKLWQIALDSPNSPKFPRHCFALYSIFLNTYVSLSIRNPILLNIYPNHFGKENILLN